MRAEGPALGLTSVAFFSHLLWAWLRFKTWLAASSCGFKHFPTGQRLTTSMDACSLFCRAFSAHF